MRYLFCENNNPLSWTCNNCKFLEKSGLICANFKELKDACYNCAYLHPDKTSFYKCYCGDCPALEKKKSIQKKKNKTKKRII